MKFSLNVTPYELPLRTYRLCAGGTFRLVHLPGTEEAGLLFDTPEAAYRARDELPVLLETDGQVVRIQNRIVDPCFSWENALPVPMVLAHRAEPPRAFTVDDVRAAVAATSPGMLMSYLVAEVGGAVKMVPYEFALDDQPAHAAHVVLINDDGVGPEHAADDAYMRALYGTLLENWHVHVVTGVLGVHDMHKVQYEQP